MMEQETLLTCPYCQAEVPPDLAICPECHEDLSALIRLRYGHAIDYNEALAAAREGDLDEAMIKARMALGARPDFVPAYVLLAKVHAKKDEWSKAQQVVRRALETAPGDEELRGFAEKLMALVEAERSTHDERRRAAARARRKSAESYLTMYERDVKRAFALGAAAAALLVLLIVGIGGRGKD
jgi:tetratricopeptide (TPR) repeat protein